MEINTETTHQVVLKSLSPEQITRMRLEMGRISNSTWHVLMQYYTNLRQSVQPISDGVLIRILTDVGYVSLYKSRGYLSINCSCKLESMEAEKQRNETLAEQVNDE